jgi:cytochrome oxidase assembly protein ShyY1
MTNLQIRATKKLDIKSIVIIHLLAVLGLVFFCSLGFWQLDRANEKALLQTKFQQNENQVAEAISSSQDFKAAANFQTLSVLAKWQPEATFLLDSQIHDGKVGVYVFTPITLGEDWLLVNRGFLPLPASRQFLESDIKRIGLIEGANKVADILAKKWLWPEVGMTLEAEQFQKQDLTWWGNITAEALVKHYGIASGRLLTEILLLDPSEANGFQRNFEIVNRSFGPEKHRAYAIQWFSFAVIIILLLIGYWLRLRKNPLQS